MLRPDFLGDTHRDEGGDSGLLRAYTFLIDIHGCWPAHWREVPASLPHLQWYLPVGMEDGDELFLRVPSDADRNRRSEWHRAMREHNSMQGKCDTLAQPVEVTGLTGRGKKRLPIS